MRVGILSQWFSPESGGASIPGVLARGLVERGHEVTVVTGYPNYPTGVLYDGYSIRAREDYREYGYAIRRVALYPDHSGRAMGRLLNYGSFAASATALGTSALKGVDVLWVYNSPATVALPMWLAQARFHVPIVLHNMDMWPDSVIQTGFVPKRGRSAVIIGLNAWVNAMYRSATFVACVSPSSAKELKRRGVPPSKLRYAPVWVDESVFRPTDGSKLRAELGYEDDDIVVGYAGALGRAQGVVHLVGAIIALPSESAIKCLILGAGTEAAELSLIAAKRPDRIRFIGQVAHDKMAAYAAVPDISFVGLSPGGQAAFAAPSKIPAIMACGKPLLAAVGGDSADLIRDSGAGIVVPPGNLEELTNALASIDLGGRASLRERGEVARRYYVDERSQSAGLDRMEQLFGDAMHARRT